MNFNQVISVVQQLPLLDQVRVAEHILHSVIEKEEKKQAYPDDRDIKLSVAADLLLNDYATDEELTVFTALDGEKVYEQK